MKRLKNRKKNNSFDDIFCHNFGISYQSIERFIDFKKEIFENGKYMRKYIVIKNWVKDIMEKFLEMKITIMAVNMQ